MRLNKLEEEQTIIEELVKQLQGVFVNSLILFKYDKATYLDVIAAQTNRL